MDLGIVTARLSNYGGSEIFLLECLKRWQEQAEISVYTADFNRNLFTEFGIDPKRVRVIVLPKTGDTGRFSLLHDTLVFPRIWERLVQRHDLTFLYLFPTQLIRRSPSVWFAAEPLRMLYDLRYQASAATTEVEVHFYPKANYEKVGINDYEILLELIEQFDLSSSFDRLATNSLATGRYLENIYGRKPDCIAYPGINPIDQVTSLSKKQQVISVGRLWKHKRVELAIQAMSYLSHGELVVVGEGPDMKKLKKLSRRLGIADRVRFTQSVTSDELNRLYAESTCCVYTPLREPFGMVPLEAAAHGIPVVGTPAGGYSEILDDTCASFVPAVPEKIAEALQDLLENPEQAQQMGINGRNKVQSCTWDNTATVLMDLFKDTAEQRPRGAPLRVKQTQLGAHYYPWYLAGDTPQHWSENREFAGVTDLPTEGHYSSTDKDVIRNHLRKATEAGLDYFTVNWQLTFEGVSETELTATRMMFDLIEDENYPIKVSILIALNDEDVSRTNHVLETVDREFTTRKAYHRVDERPIVWYFLSDAFMGYFYHHHQDLARLSADWTPIATGGILYSRSLPRLMREFFKGWCPYSPLQIASAKSRRELWQDGYLDFHEQNRQLNVFTICPGYDDSHLSTETRKTSRFRSIKRNELKTYEEMQDVAANLNPTPDLIIVTSFNEFHENTHIESSRRHGDAYLKSTREFKERLIRQQPALSSAKM